MEQIHVVADVPIRGEDEPREVQLVDVLFQGGAQGEVVQSIAAREGSLP